LTAHVAPQEVETALNVDDMRLVPVEGEAPRGKPLTQLVLGQFGLFTGVA